MKTMNVSRRSLLLLAVAGLSLFTPCFARGEFTLHRYEQRLETHAKASASSLGDPKTLEEKKTDFTPITPMMLSSAHSGDLGSATGNGSFSTNVSLDSSSGVFRFTGNASANGTTTRGSATQTAFTQGGSRGTALAGFRLFNVPYTFEVTGQASVTTSLVGLSPNTASRRVKISILADSGTGTNTVHYSELVLANNTNKPLSGTGTLPAAGDTTNYMVFVEIEGFAHANKDTAASENSSSSVNFSVRLTPGGPQPTPTPTPTPTPSSKQVLWKNAAGGSFQVPENWDPQKVPGVDDTAVFRLAAAYTVNVGSAATDRLIINDGDVTFTNAAYTVGSTTESPPGFIFDNTTFTLASGQLNTVAALIGETRDSRVNISSNGVWVNTSTLSIGGVGNGFLAVEAGGTLHTGNTQIGSGPGGGDVVVDGRNAHWQADELGIGGSGIGTLTIEAGGNVLSNQAVVGSGANGIVNIQGTASNGDQSRWDLDDLFIGNGGIGTVNVLNGGYLIPTNVVISQGSSLTLRGVGEVTPGVFNESELRSGGDTTVDGTLLIEQGAFSSHLDGDFTIGSGNVIVRGFNATLGASQIQDVFALTVGFNAQGSLRIEDGAVVQAIDATVGSEGGSGGISVTGRGSFGPSSLSVFRDLYIGFDASSSPSGSLSVTGGGFVEVLGDVSSVSGITVDRSPDPSIPAVTVGGADPVSGAGSAIDVKRTLAIGFFAPTTSVLIMENGKISCFDAVLGNFADGFGKLFVGANGPGTAARFEVLNNLRIGADAGKGEVTLRNGGIVTVGGETTVGAGGAILGNGTLSAPNRNVLNGGVIAPGLSPGLLTLEANLVQTSSGILRMEIAGTAPGQFDVLHVTGNATLGGTMEVPFLNSFLPAAGQTFNLLAVDGSISGNFSQVTFPNLKSGFQFKTEIVNGKQQLTALSNGVPANPLLNISTRLQVGTGDNALIGGFIVTGNGAKKVIVRGMGPSLASGGQPVPGRLNDPTLELRDNAGSLIFSNDNWIDSPQKQAIIDSTIPPGDDREAAIVATLNPGAYTAILRGTNNSTGVGLVEIYDLSQDASATMANISTRGVVQSGDQVMIGGFIVGGSAGTKILVRALGPTLGAVGVAGALSDTTLELRNGSGTLLDSNDDWRTNHETEIQATTLAPPSNAESAILATLPSGNYTAIVRGKNNTTGVGLVEFFRLQ